MLTGINVPIRIGDTTVMPGDIALGDPEGITFIPPQLAQKVADDTEMDRLVDEWGHMMLREGKYTPGQIDAKWTREMVEQFNRWLDKKGSTSAHAGELIAVGVRWSETRRHRSSRT